MDEDASVHMSGQQLTDEERLEKAVAAAEHALIEFEIAVETFRVEVDNLARLHHQRLGPLYARIEELDALIAEAVAARTGHPDDIRRAVEARNAARPVPSADELFGRPFPDGGDGAGQFEEKSEEKVRIPEQEGSRRVRPSKEAQRLYRELARQAHPDLAQDPGEQKRRSAFIARVNDAYARGDVEELKALAEEWAAGPEVYEKLHGVEMLSARLEWLAARMENLAAVRAELENSAVGAMLRMASDDPGRFLDEIAGQLLGQIAEREARLAALLDGVAWPYGR